MDYLTKKAESANKSTPQSFYVKERRLRIPGPGDEKGRLPSAPNRPKGHKIPGAGL
jgi:hypothetical protein